MLLNFFSTAIIHMTCLQLNQLVQYTYFYQMLLLSSYTKFFSFCNRYRVFSIALLAVSLITLLTLLIKGGRRLKFEELEKVMAGGKNKKRDDDDD